MKRLTWTIETGNVAWHHFALHQTDDRFYVTDQRQLDHLRSEPTELTPAEAVRVLAEKLLLVVGSP